MDEVQDQAKNELAVEDNSASVPPADEPTTSEQSAETDGQAEQAQIDEPAAEETESQTSERKPTRAERRIHELNDKLKQATQPDQQGSNYGQPPTLPQYSEDEIVTPERLQADVVQAAQSIAGQVVEQRLSQERAANNFQLDKAELVKNPLLDENSEAYLPEVEQAITEEFEQRAFKVIGFNPVTGQPVTVLDPSVRLTDIAKRHLKVAEAAAKRSSAEVKNSVARTADEAAIAPGATKRAEKPFSELSKEEMEAKLGIVEV